MFFLIKLLTIFIGSGFATYFAFIVAKEVYLLIRQILNSPGFKNIKDKLNLRKTHKISSQSGFYEVLFPHNQSMKLFSSHKGMKLLG